MKMLHSQGLRCFTFRLTNLYYNLSITRHSALFINGPKATENFVFVVPHIDFSNNDQHKELLKKELSRRNKNLNINQIENLWSMYEQLKTRKLNYEKKKNEISRELGKLLKIEPDSKETQRLKIQIDLVKDNLKKLKEPLWSAEEAAIVEVLKLPNILHPNTPDGENTILYSHLNPVSTNIDHLKVANENNLVQFKKNENYYLKNDAAVFELGAKFYFSSLLKKNGFVQFSNPDFVKSVIVEGCGIDHTNPDSSFILHHNEETKVQIDNRLHLMGGGSLCAFMAYYAKNVLYSKVFPLQYFTMGRQYIPSPSVEDSLFHVSQSSVVQIFGATRNSQELDAMLNNLVEFLKSSYVPLGYHFRMSIASAEKLHLWESLRIVLEMYSSSLNSYVEIANISVSGDFISKRLMFTYVDNKQSYFPHVISGTILNVPKFLACVLEQDEKFTLPKHFAVENWTM